MYKRKDKNSARVALEPAISELRESERTHRHRGRHRAVKKAPLFMYVYYTHLYEQKHIILCDPQIKQMWFQRRNIVGPTSTMFAQA